MNTSFQKALEILDEYVPGWEQKINLDTFDLKDFHLCILGQLYGDYADAPDFIRFYYKDHNGRILFESAFYPPNIPEYHDMWTREIISRRMRNA